MEVYDEKKNILNDPGTVRQTWKRDFKDLYNNFTPVNDDSQRCLEEIKYENTVKEQAMNDPLYIGKTYLNRNVETSEVHKHVWKMKNKKSPGIDSLPYEVLKNDTVINALTHLYQMCLDSGKIPSVWTKAIISPIPKSSTSDSRIPMNYRGISLISCVAKIYSSILNARVLDVSEEEELIVDEQNGFHSGRSCQNHIIVLDSIIRNRLAEDIPTFTAFIDLQKAFDCINRDLLLNKILANGIDSKVFLAIKSLYSYTEACVKLPGGLYTDWFQTSFGVKQGDNLSPTLFSVFLNDLATVINDLNVGVNAPNAGNVSILLYADDIVLIAPSEENLQSMLNALSAWTEKWLLNIHPDKSQIVHFRKNGSDATKHCVKCGKINLDIVSFYKYLGVIFTEHLNYEKNATILSKAGGRALGSITAKYKAQGFMGYSTFTKLYEACITPILDYSASIWGFSRYNCLEAIQNRAVHVYLGVHKFAPLLALEGDMGWMSCEHRQQLSILRLWNRILKLPDDRLTKKIFIGDYYLAQSGHRNWCWNVFKIVEKTNLESSFYERQPVDIEDVKDQFLNIQNRASKQALPKKAKLRTYCTFKEYLSVENYVKYNLTPSERSAMAQFRFGILPLNIETGRFRNQPVQDRLCTLCEFNEIEDECHFLFKCSLYNDLRNDWIRNITDKTPDFVEMDTTTKFKVIFAIHHRITAKFILRSYNIRKENLFR